MVQCDEATESVAECDDFPLERRDRFTGEFQQTGQAGAGAAHHRMQLYRANFPAKADEVTRQ